MLTKNGKALLGSYFAGDVDVTMKSVMSTDQSVNAWYGKSQGATYFVTVGGGDTVPTSSDVDLDDPLYNYAIGEGDLTLISISSSKFLTQTSPSSYSDDYIASATTTYKNNTNESITVKEVGIMFYSSYYGNAFLLTRDVLETPIVIAPGKSYSFSVTI